MSKKGKHKQGVAAKGKGAGVNLKYKKQSGAKKTLVKHAKKAKRNFGSGKAKYDGADKIPHGYQATDRVLLVGEGNFSFARALVRLFDGNGFSLVATCFDTEEILHEKYEDATDILSEVQASGAKVVFGVDGTNLAKGLGLAKQIKKQGLSEEDKFDHIVFNFPHCGLGIKDQDRNVKANQTLLEHFYNSASELLKLHGQVHLTLKTGKPYDLWNPVGMAYRVSGGRLQQKTVCKFDPSAFPGYAHRRTLGYKEGLSNADSEEVLGKSHTFIFEFR